MKHLLAAMLATTTAIKPIPLPPVEYDHPYTGVLVTTVATTLKGVRDLCPLPAVYGCAFRMHSGGCLIVLAPDKDIREAGWTTELVRRHEIGHCNGWPSNHPGARLLPQNRSRNSVKQSD